MRCPGRLILRVANVAPLVMYKQGRRRCLSQKGSTATVGPGRIVFLFRRKC